MAEATLTVANSTIMLSVDGVFSTPQKIQGYAADDIFNVPNVETVETMMGVDGLLSGGFVFKEIKWSITLMANSPSSRFFTVWQQQQQLLKDTLVANGLVILPSLNAKFVMTKGFLSGFPMMPSAGKITKPRTYEITWQTINSAPV